MGSRKGARTDLRDPAGVARRAGAFKLRRSADLRELRSDEKRRDRLGETERGKGTKLVVACGQGVPLACLTSSASPEEITLAEGVVEEVAAAKEPTPLIADRAYESDTLRIELKPMSWDPVCPHRRGRRPPKNLRRLRATPLVRFPPRRRALHDLQV